MTRRQIFIASCIGVSVLTAAMGFIAWHRVEGNAPANVEDLKDARAEGRTLVPMCDAAESVKTQLAEGTSHFHEYDAAKAKQVLADVVMPVIDAHDLACAHAASDLVQLQQLRPVEAWVVAGTPKVAAMQQKLVKAKTAAAALRATLDRNPSAPEVGQSIAALLATMD